MKSRPYRNHTKKTTTLECWLTFSAEKVTGMRLTEPPTSKGERKIKVALTFPWSLFSEPELRANITLDGTPRVADAEQTIADLSRAIEEIPGVQMVVNYPEGEGWEPEPDA